jgi:3-hydroxyacyl-CoA dehydrogenase
LFVVLQECVFESVEVKSKVFMDMDPYITDNMVAASSSSCLGPSQFAENMKNRHRVVVAHPVCICNGLF